MRTTLEIEDDVLRAAKELAQQEGSTTGRVISALARRSLTAPKQKAAKRDKIKAGFRLVPSRGEVVTLEHVQDLMDREGV